MHRYKHSRLSAKQKWFIGSKHEKVKLSFETLSGWLAFNIFFYVWSQGFESFVGYFLFCSTKSKRIFIKYFYKWFKSNQTTPWPLLKTVSEIYGNITLPYIMDLSTNIETFYVPLGLLRGSRHHCCLIYSRHKDVYKRQVYKHAYVNNVFLV